MYRAGAIPLAYQYWYIAQLPVLRQLDDVERLGVCMQMLRHVQIGAINPEGSPQGCLQAIQRQRPLRQEYFDNGI